jgi:hypothetical protein
MTGNICINFSNIKKDIAHQISDAAFYPIRNLLNINHYSGQSAHSKIETSLIDKIATICRKAFILLISFICSPIIIFVGVPCYIFSKSRQQLDERIKQASTRYKIAFIHRSKQKELLYAPKLEYKNFQSVMNRFFRQEFSPLDGHKLKQELLETLSIYEKSSTTKIKNPSEIDYRFNYFHVLEQLHYEANLRDFCLGTDILPLQFKANSNVELTDFCFYKISKLGELSPLVEEEINKFGFILLKADKKIFLFADGFSLHQDLYVNTLKLNASSGFGIAKPICVLEHGDVIKTPFAHIGTVIMNEEEQSLNLSRLTPSYQHDKIKKIESFGWKCSLSTENNAAYSFFSDFSTIQLTSLSEESAAKLKAGLVYDPAHDYGLKRVIATLEQQYQLLNFSDLELALRLFIFVISRFNNQTQETGVRLLGDCLESSNGNIKERIFALKVLFDLFNIKYSIIEKDLPTFLPLVIDYDICGYTTSPHRGIPHAWISLEINGKNFIADPIRSVFFPSKSLEHITITDFLDDMERLAREYGIK